jgi:O-acetyl-ADP-ribose deacetylase (regulator of RNase III)
MVMSPHAEVTAVEGDLLRQPECDAIVNSANEYLIAGGGVCGAIYRAAGPELEPYTRRLAPLALGEAVLFEALKHLELATDPSVEMAALIREVAAQRDSHKTRVWEFQKTSEALARALNKERERAKNLEEQVANLKVQNNRLEKRLDEVMCGNPSAVYEAFMKGSKSKSRS